MSVLAHALASAPAADDDPVRERILEAALEQFKVVGLRRTTVGDVARRAGVGRVTVYRRIGHKPELIAAAIQSEVGRVTSAVREAIAQLQGPEDRLVEAFAAGVEIVHTHPLLRRLLETEPEDLLPYVTVGFGPMVELARRFVADEVMPGVTDPDPELLGELLARLAQSLVLTPGGAIPVDDRRRLRGFARAYLAPLLHT